jgi:hypothetical protein
VKGESKEPSGSLLRLKKLGGEKRAGDQCDCPFFVDFSDIELLLFLGNFSGFNAGRQAWLEAERTLEAVACTL